ncbi:hypothetical protein AB0I55_29625 [Actinocatenispora sera]|uniref:hypothetical protein n=1 Tax=Actinocatenispora sera TaxID=390989 RepID=UPI0033C23F9D
MLFWIGAMLAPLAGIALWFARDGGELRGTAVLAIAGTVLIGLSVVLRRDADGVRIELQENLAAEIEAVRGDLGSAMTTALQRTKHGTHAELAALQEQLDTLAARLGADPAREPVGASAAQAPAGARRPGMPPRRRDPVADSMQPGAIDPVRDSLRPGAVDPVRDSLRPGAVDAVRDSLRPGAMEPVRDGVRPGATAPGRNAAPAAAGRGTLPPAPDPLRDSGVQRFEPLRVERRKPQPEAASPAPVVRRRSPRAVDPLRDSVARLDPWAELRGEDPPPPLSPAPVSPRAARRARHRAED